MVDRNVRQVVPGGLVRKVWEWFIREDMENGYVVIILGIVALFVLFWTIR